MPVDKSNYAENWSAIVRRINERAGNKCEWCGAPNGAYIRRRKSNPAQFEIALQDECEDSEFTKPIRVVLTTAHLNHDTSDNRDENLAALCQYHHLTHDAQYHASNAKRTRERKKAEEIKKSGQLELF